MNTINKNLNKKCGIYLIINLINGKRYIGSSKDLYERLYHHVWSLNRGSHENKHIQSAWNKYGESSFEYGILEYCQERERLEREGHYISTINPEYNMDEINLDGLTSHSKESKNKIANSVTNNWNSEDRQKNCKTRNIPCYVYSIKSWELVKENVSIKEVCNFLGLKTTFNDKYIDNRICSGEFAILSKKYDDINELKDYVCEHLLKYNSKNFKEDKYLIAEISGERKYFKTIQSLLDCIKCSCKSTISSHLDATKENPYIPKNTDIKIYFSKEYIKYAAVPGEESQELLQTKIGEGCDANPEVITETKESVTP
jgi:group I intron endonuclease